MLKKSEVVRLDSWRTPGGRLGRAAATATGDMLVNAINAGSGYSQEQALQDFATGFLGDLTGGGIGEAVSRYGAKSVAKGFQKLGLEVPWAVVNSFDNVGDLVGAVGNFSRGKGGSRIGSFQNGNLNTVFNNILKKNKNNIVSNKNGVVKLKDGTIITTHQSSSGPTLDINQDGAVYKIRIGQ